MSKVFVILMAGLLAGCQSILSPYPLRDPTFAPARPAESVPPTQNPGSIFQSGTEIRFYEDNLARRVGDIITVKLTENTNAQKKADTTANRKTSTSVSVPTILGQNGQKILGYELNSSLDSNNAFNGKGESKQSNALTGNISVTVIEVLPNGILRIQGEKRVSLNQGHEYVRLSGLVRPADIDTGNVVDSNKIADATVMYTGDGVVNDVNRMGWLSRFFNSVLFPF